MRVIRRFFVVLIAVCGGMGQAPDTVTFFATSHYHFDHIANARDFASATWLVQKAEVGSLQLVTFANYARGFRPRFPALSTQNAGNPGMPRRVQAQVRVRF